jgi:signal transduction histidine kinase
VTPCQHNKPFNPAKFIADSGVADLQSEIERLRIENEALKSQLNQAQKSSAIGELVSTTTHEFNNVLMMILNYAKLGLRNQDQAARNKAFEKILKAGQRASKITNAVLGMARNRSEHFAPTNLENVVDETMILLERELQKYRINVEVVVEENLPMVSVVGNQIQQVLLNLMINARQAMSDGGQLIIRLKQDPQANTVDLCVRDFGPGIAEEKLRQIFEPYYTTKSGPDQSGKGGTGLGLHACHNIIEAHGGKIRVESSLGKGTCFTLKIPINRHPVTPTVCGGSEAVPVTATV